VCTVQYKPSSTKDGGKREEKRVERYKKLFWFLILGTRHFRRVHQPVQKMEEREKRNERRGKGRKERRKEQRGIASCFGSNSSFSTFQTSVHQPVSSKDGGKGEEKKEEKRAEV